MEDIEDLGKNSSFPKNSVQLFQLLVLVRNYPADIFGEKSSKEPGILKVLKFLTVKAIKFGAALPMKLCQPRFRKVKNIIEFCSLLPVSLSSQE